MQYTLRHTAGICLLCCLFLPIISPRIYGQTTKVAELQQQLKAKIPDTTRLRLLMKLSGAYTSVDPAKKFEIAVRYKELAEEIGVDTTVVEAYLDMGVSYGVRSKLDSALYYFSKGYDYSLEIDYQRGIARSLANIGFAYDRLDNRQGAVENYMGALRIFKQLKHVKGINQCLINIGSIYFDLAQYKVSESYFLQALKSYTKIKDEKGIAYALFTLGGTSKALGDFKKAEEYYNRSLTIRERIGDLNGIALTRWGLAQLQVAQKKYDLALKNLVIARELNHKLNDLYQESAVIITMAEAYLGKKDYKKAESLGLEAIHNAKVMKSQIVMAEVLEKMIDIFKAQNNIEEAFRYQSRYLEVTDSIKIDETVKDVTLTEFDRVRLENANLAKNNEDITSRNSGYQKTIIIVSILLALVVVLLLILYRRNKEKQAANKLLRQQAAEIASINEELESLNLEINAQMMITASQNDELEKLNVVKNKFFSIVSHDLRSPLATLQMLFKLYRRGQLNDEELNEMLTALEETIYSTSAFLDNLLEWAKSQLEGMSVNPEVFDAGSLITDNIRLMESQIRLKALEIKNKATEPAIMYADPNMINVVVRNLLSNSVKFCRPGDTITFDAKTDNGKVMISIHDTGPGISPQDKEKLFSLEHTISESTSGEKGHHIGLILCKDMVEQNKGTIRVESELGKGTGFYIELPGA